MTYYLITKSHGWLYWLGIDYENGLKSMTLNPRSIKKGEYYIAIPHTDKDTYIKGIYKGNNIVIPGVSLTSELKKIKLGSAKEISKLVKLFYL